MTNLFSPALPEKTLIIRDAASEYLNSIEDLYIASIRHNRDGFVQNLNFHGDIKQTARVIQHANGLFAVGLVDDVVVAMGGLRRSHSQPDLAELCKLHVRADYQGRGYGRQMSDYFIARAKDMHIKKIELHVTTSQTAAIGLYRSLGFYDDHIESWKTHFEGEDLRYETLFMGKNLTDK